MEQSANSRRSRTRSSLYNCLYRSQSFCSRQTLAQSLGLSLPTVYQNLAELMEAGLVEDSTERQSTGGRRAGGLRIVPDARIAVGVYLTASSLRLAAADLRLRELAYRELPLPDGASLSELGNLLAEELERFLDDHGLPRERLLGVGAALPAVLSPDNRRIASAPTLSLADASPEELTGRLPYPARVENDASCGGFAECFTRNSRGTMAYLSLEDGVGGAILIDGVPYAGQRRRSGEFGHMCIEPGGLRCSCGRRGCLEAYCSPRRVREQLGLSLEDFFAGTEGRDPACGALWDNMLRHLALGINNIHLALDCDVVLGGSLAEYLPPYLPRLREYAAAGDPFNLGTEYLYLSTLRQHTVPLGAALHFIASFLEQI